MDKISEVIKFFNKQYRIQAEKNRTNRKLKKYYTESKQDKRGNVAKVLDYIGIRIIIFFVITLLILVQYDNIYLSILAALVGTTGFHIVSILLRNKKAQKVIYNKRKYFASQKVYKEIMSKGILEFEEYIKIVLNKSAINIKKTLQINERNILMFSTFKNTDVLIICKKYNQDISVLLKEMEEFSEIMRRENYSNGIIITTSDFTKESQVYLEKNFIAQKITLIDKEKLLKIIENVGLFPTIKEIDEYTVDKIEKKEKRLIAYRALFLAQSKTKSYIFLALLLLIWTRYTVFPVYYFSISILLFVLAGVTFYSNMKKRKENVKEFTFDEMI